MEVATLGRVVEAATGVAEVVPMLLEGAVETRTTVVRQADEGVDAPAKVEAGERGVAWRRGGICGEVGERRQQLRQQERERQMEGVL